MGATIPIGLLFREALGIDTVFFSFSTADEDYHAPNEFFRLRRMQEGLMGVDSLLALAEPPSVMDQDIRGYAALQGSGSTLSLNPPARHRADQ